MSFLNCFQRLDPSSSAQSSWSSSKHVWSQQVLDEIPTWLSSKKKEYENKLDFNDSFNEDINKTGSFEQRFDVNLIKSHKEKSQDNSATEPLRCMLLGVAGAGKSFVIKALRKLLGYDVHVSALTGAAGVLIACPTIHWLLKLPITSRQQHPLTGNALKVLQERWCKSCHQNHQYLIIDEISMAGQNLMYWIDQRLRQATGKNTVFGGVSVIICGDFGQLFPVFDTALFIRPGSNASAKKTHAFMLYKLFTEVIFLKKNFRSKDPRYTELLLRIRNGIQTNEDIVLLEQRFAKSKRPDMTEFPQATTIMLSFKKSDVFDFNCSRLLDLGEPIARIDAEHSDTSAKRATSDVARLPQTVALSLRTSIMITLNLWQEAGIFNGLTGEVYDIIYAPGTLPPSLPLAVNRAS
jgi:ATP-dependent DNA helicase PIF1